MSRSIKSASRRSRGRSTWSRLFTPGRTIVGGSVLLTVAFCAVILINGAVNGPPQINLAAIPDESRAFEIQGRDHVQPGAAHPAYNSNPPTSGWHYADPARLGVYTTPPEDETLIHNLEHGQIWLSYRDADDQEALALLTDIQRRYPQHVIVTYRPADETRIAAAAWGRLLTQDTLDSDALYAFIMRYRNRGPELPPGM